MRRYYAFGADLGDGPDGITGWVHRFPSESQRDEFVTAHKWCARALGSSDFRVRWAKRLAIFGWPVRIDRCLNVGTVRMSPYEADLRKRRKAEGA